MVSANCSGVVDSPSAVSIISISLTLRGGLPWQEITRVRAPPLDTPGVSGGCWRGRRFELPGPSGMWILDSVGLWLNHEHHHSFRRVEAPPGRHLERWDVGWEPGGHPGSPDGVDDGRLRPATALYDRLVEQAPNTSAVPALAESFEPNSDGASGRSGFGLAFIGTAVSRLRPTT